MRSLPAKPIQALLAAVVGCLLLAPAAAADTQTLRLGQGSLSGPKGSWQASAVPPGSILIDYLDAGGAKLGTYGKSFGTLAPRGLDASGFRPRSLPTRHALVAGATGSQIRKVKLHLRGGIVRVLRTVAAPREWSLRNRLFAYGWTVAGRHAKAMVQVTKIEGLNARGKTIATLRKVVTDAY